MESNDVRLAFIRRLDRRDRAFVDRKDRLNFTMQFYKEMGLLKSINGHKNTISSVYKGLKAQVCPAFMREDEELVKMFFRVGKTYQSNLLSEEKEEPMRKRRSTFESKKERFLSVLKQMKRKEKDEEVPEKKIKEEPVDPSFPEGQTPTRHELERLKNSLVFESSRIKTAVKEQQEKILEYESMIRRIDEVLQRPTLPATLSELDL